MPTPDKAPLLLIRPRSLLFGDPLARPRRSTVAFRPLPLPRTIHP